MDERNPAAVGRCFVPCLAHEGSCPADRGSPHAVVSKARLFEVRSAFPAGKSCENAGKIAKLGRFIPKFRDFRVFSTRN